jgi:hypothetical protein
MSKNGGQIKKSFLLSRFKPVYPGWFRIISDNFGLLLPEIRLGGRCRAGGLVGKKQQRRVSPKKNRFSMAPVGAVFALLDSRAKIIAQMQVIVQRLPIKCRVVFKTGILCS